MANIDERIQAAQKALEDANKLYIDGERQYKSAEALYNQAKAAAEQAAGFVKALSNTNVDTLQALRIAASFAPNPKEYAAAVNQPGADIQAIQKAQLNSAIGKSNVAELAKKKAEREIQRATKFLNGIGARINVIKNQLGIVISGISLRRKADAEKLKSTVKVKVKRKKITLNNARAFIKKNRAAIKAIAKAALLYVTAKLINDQIQALAANVQQLGELVDSVNDQIESIETKQDVLKARITRDAALVSLNSAERKITKIRDTVKTLETILLVTSLALNILLLFPLPTTPKVVQKIVNVMLTLDSITILLGITRSALDDLVAEVQYQKSRLLPISDVIDQALNDNLDPTEIAGLLSGGNLGQLGLLPGLTYRGFEFAIYEENDPKFVVAGNKRRYAVALDRSGFTVLQSRPSFTLDPDVLVEELKLIIDERNLEP
jgi:Mg2+ and Co2+ transporter CorA